MPWTSKVLEYSPEGPARHTHAFGLCSLAGRAVESGPPNRSGQFVLEGWHLLFFPTKGPNWRNYFYFFFHFYNVFVVHFLILLPSSFSESLSKLSCARNNSVLCCWTRVLNLEPYFPLEPTRSCIIFVWFCRSLFCSCLRVIFWIFSNFQWFISQKGEFQGQQCYSACIL